MAIIDRIKFDGLRTRDWLVYKHPSEKLVIGSQLIVNEGQVALFLKGGQICDVFLPGTYTLNAANLPILQSVVNIPFGGNTPFTAEIYYINSTTKLDMNWGTIDPIQIIDPKYFIKLRVRAFGQFGLKISDYSLFLKELIGAMRKDDVVQFDKILTYYRGLLITKIKSIIADEIINKKISALEISAKLDDISSAAKEKVIPEFQRFGLHVVNFFIQSINFPDDDFNQINKILEDRAAFEIMGDNRYATKRSFDVYEGAATNDSGIAGAFVAGGLGLSAGANFANHANSVLQPSLGAGHQQTRCCPNCKMEIPVGIKFCSNCGTAVTDRKLICNNCNSENPLDSKFCCECGHVLKEEKCECGAAISPGAKFCNECGKKVEYDS